MLLGHRLEELGDQLPVVHLLDRLHRRSLRRLRSIGFDGTVFAESLDELDEPGAIIECGWIDLAVREVRDRAFHREAGERPLERDLRAAIGERVRTFDLADETAHQVFGLREIPSSYLRRQQGRGNRFCADGKTNLAIHPFYNRIEGHEARFGINHIGFLTSEMQATMAELSRLLKIASRPSNRPYAEFRFRDPEGNALDLSQTKGWEVDVDKWETAA